MSSTLLAVAVGIFVSILVLANVVLVVASLVGRREQAQLWLAPLAKVAALFLLPDSPIRPADVPRRKSGAS
jgi:ABC-type Na+ efflux pump permease subunit